MPGVDPERRSYFSRASFADPDGNEWQLQEVTERLPGRVEPTDVDALAQLLLETALHHGAFEAIAPKHDWWNWYAPYLDARQQGKSPERGRRDRRPLHGGGARCRGFPMRSSSLEALEALVSRRVQRR